MWGDLATDLPPVEPDDEGYTSLIQLVPDEKREMASSMLRGLLSNVKAQLSPDQYVAYCGHLKAAWAAHSRGDAATARTILAAYGLPYDMLVAQMG
jgi:hypothetical protein